ncbi:hypothetical protein GO986_12210 [Deinococcus sp. HMF7620]|uniref:Uncharacterized protein n=1 Tax=Deinococcus arboris TaxID=2682977 RepID=A0A7C9HS56_9DEIO|nr:MULTISPECIES: hypothetical protein [Deinococcus]MBZ9752218.1 hypothetical protein [Deinococcus betulae]MVN87529.1 hypothetical protein [Deinococcus arboris]
MMYLAATSSSLHGAHPRIHVMTGPRTGGLRPLGEGRLWASDNDAYSGRFCPERFGRHLQRLLPHAQRCLFVAAPDFPGDPDSTLACWRACMPHLALEFPYPFAFVAQTGCVPEDIPGDAGALFLAGHDAWREGQAGADLIQHAREALGLHVHIGRVNSASRLRHFAGLGAHSADGTYLSYQGVTRGLAVIGRWLDQTPGVAP